LTLRCLASYTAFAITSHVFISTVQRLGRL
jgi:hypothetical protein